MPHLRADIAGTRHNFIGMKHLLAAASPPRSGDELAGIAAESAAIVEDLKDAASDQWPRPRRRRRT